MSPNLGQTDQDFEYKFAEWKAEVSRYEGHTGRGLDQGIKIAVLPQTGSNSIIDASADQQHDFGNSFAQLESVIQGYIQSRERPIKGKSLSLGRLRWR